MNQKDKVEAERRRLRECIDGLLDRYGTDNPPALHESRDFGRQWAEFVDSTDPELLWPEGTERPAVITEYSVLKLPEEWSVAMPDAAHRLLGKDDEGWFLKDPIPRMSDGRLDAGMMCDLLRRAFELAGPSVREFRYWLEEWYEEPSYVSMDGVNLSFGRAVTPEEDNNGGASS